MSISKFSQDERRKLRAIAQDNLDNGTLKNRVLVPLYQAVIITTLIIMCGTLLVIILLALLKMPILVLTPCCALSQPAYIAFLISSFIGLAVLVLSLNISYLREESAIVSAAYKMGWAAKSLHYDIVTLNKTLKGTGDSINTNTNQSFSDMSKQEDIHNNIIARKKSIFKDAVYLYKQDQLGVNAKWRNHKEKFINNQNRWKTARYVLIDSGLMTKTNKIMDLEEDKIIEIIQNHINTTSIDLLVK